MNYLDIISNIISISHDVLATTSDSNHTGNISLQTISMTIGHADKNKDFNISWQKQGFINS